MSRLRVLSLALALGVSVAGTAGAATMGGDVTTTGNQSYGSTTLPAIDADASWADSSASLGSKAASTWID